MAAVLSVTLQPHETAPVAGQAVQGSAGEAARLADFVRNLVLFAPLGASLAWARFRPLAAVSIAALLAVALEAGQLALPGRHANPLDVLADALGSGVGAAIAGGAPGWLRPAPRSAGWLSLGAAVSILAIFLATGVLLAPAVPDRELVCHLPPDFTGVRSYGGAVGGAWLDEVELRNGPIPHPRRVRDRLETAYDLRLEVEWAPPREHTAALLAITSPAREVVFVGVERRDLVLRYLSRGGSIGLEPIRIRFSGALGAAPVGESISVRIRRETRGALCVTAGESRECSAVPTLGDGWRLVAISASIGSLGAGIAAATWIALLFVPVGYWGAASRRPSVPWLLSGAGLLVLPALTGLIATPELLGGVAGLLAGAALWRARGVTDSQPGGRAGAPRPAATGSL